MNDPRNAPQASATTTPTTVKVDDDRVLLFKLHGNNYGAMLAIADRIGPMQRRRLSREIQEGNAKGDRYLGRTQGAPMEERKDGLKVDNVQPPIKGVLNATVGDALRGLLAVGYEVVELFFQTEEADRDSLKGVIQATVRLPAGAGSTPMHAGKADIQRQAKATIAEMTPSLLEVLDGLVGNRLDVYPNLDRPNGNGGINRGTITVNLTGPITGQAAKNRLGFQAGELVLIEIPKTPKAPKAPAAVPTVAR